MSTTQTLMTADDLFRQPPGQGRRELVKGELRMMAPAGFEHGDISLNIALRLRVFVEAHQLGKVVAGETGFIIATNPDTVRSPDAAFVSSATLKTTGIPKQYFPGAPDLAVEVISPGDTLYDVDEKVADWLTAGTGIVWVINPKQKSVAVHRRGRDVKVLGVEGELSGEEVVPGFTCRVADLFA